MSHRAVLIEVTGKVQEVFFRASTKEICDNLSIKGWVKNLPAGDVLIHAEGSDHQIDQLKLWCRKGSPLSRVKNITINETERLELLDFVIKY